MLTTLRALICRWFHGAIYRPVNGHYRCQACLRTWPVEWAMPEPRPEASMEAGAR